MGGGGETEDGTIYIDVIYRCPISATAKENIWSSENLSGSLGLLYPEIVVELSNRGGFCCVQLRVPSQDPLAVLNL